MRRIVRLELFLAVVLAVGLVAGVAHADPVKCKAAIAKSTATFAQAKTKLLQKCAENRFKGKILGTCPDPKTQPKIDKAVSKAKAGIVKACGGKDKICGGVNAADDDTLISIGWNTVATCPDFEAQGGCTNPIADCNDIGTCLTCIAEEAVDQAIDLSYANLKPTNPKIRAEKPTNKCQLAVGKAAAAFFNAKTKALQKCWDTVNKKNLPDACPPFGAGDGKAATSIGKAQDKFESAVLKACCGPDKACNTGDDQLTSAIGTFPECPPVTVPGIGGDTCAQTITTVGDLRDCIECVSEYKVDCVTLLESTGFPNAPAYPAECASPLPATPTPTPSETPTPIVTETATPGGPTATVTAAAATPTATSTAAAATPTVTSTPGGPTATLTPTPGGTPSCPTKITFTGTSTDGVLDTGWTGQAHDSTVISEGTVTVSVTSCAGAAPSCGVCAYTGPIANATGFVDSQRCSGNSFIHCTSDGNCTGNGTCKFYFGTFLPLSAGGVATCVENTFNGGVTGTADVDVGSSAGTASITSRVFTAADISHPCPRCLGDTTANDGVQGGTCNGGSRNGLNCDASGSSPNIQFGTTSLDCPPSINNSPSAVAALPIDLSNTTGSKSRTLSAANPVCRADATKVCQCDTCNNAAATPCSSNADCVAVGATLCGGKRCLTGTNAGAACSANSECPGSSCNIPGLATKPHQCDVADDCVADPGTPGPNDRSCSTGPFDTFCTPVETFRGCTVNGDCNFPGDTCSGGKFRDCFDNGNIGDVVTATGAVDTPVNHQSNPRLAALFCIGPTTAPAVNTAAGLPGLGRLELLGHSTDNGTP